MLQAWSCLDWRHVNIVVHAWVRTSTVHLQWRPAGTQPDHTKAADGTAGDNGEHSWGQTCNCSRIEDGSMGCPADQQGRVCSARGTHRRENTACATIHQEERFTSTENRTCVMLCASDYAIRAVQVVQTWTQQQVPALKRLQRLPTDTTVSIHAVIFETFESLTGEKLYRRTRRLPQCGLVPSSSVTSPHMDTSCISLCNVEFFTLFPWKHATLTDD